MYFKERTKQESKKKNKYKIIIFSLTISLISVPFSIYLYIENIRLTNEVNYYKSLSLVQENQKLTQENSYLKNEVNVLNNEVANLQKRIKQINQTYNAQISQLQEVIKDKDVQIINLQQQINFYQNQLQKAQLLVITLYGKIEGLGKVKRIEFESEGQKFITDVKDNYYNIKLINYKIYNVKIYYEKTLSVLSIEVPIGMEDYKDFGNWKLESDEAQYKYDWLFKQK
jgi:uncharacterized protein YlxW (UPF0749 family)